MMRVLTVKQPWAWAIMHARKNVENRSWSTKYRGPIAIHAGKSTDPGAFDFHPFTEAWRRGPARTINDTGIIGIVDLIDVVTDSDSPWAEPGSKHLVLANPRPLARPLPFTGGLGLRTLHPQIVAELLIELAITNEED